MTIIRCLAFVLVSILHTYTLTAKNEKITNLVSDTFLVFFQCALQKQIMEIDNHIENELLIIESRSYLEQFHFHTENGPY